MSVPAGARISFRLAAHSLGYSRTEPSPGRRAGPRPRPPGRRGYRCSAIDVDPHPCCLFRQRSLHQGHRRGKRVV